MKKLALKIVLAAGLVGGANTLMNMNFIKSSEYSFMNDSVKVNNNEIFYSIKGTGDKSIVLISGSGVASSYTDMYKIWSTMENKPEVSLFIYDRPGMGKSSLTEDRRDADSLADELYKTLEATSLKAPYTLVAHSMSGLTALRFAQKYPESVKGIVLIDSASPVFAETFEDPMTNTMGRLKKLRETGILRIMSFIPFTRNQFESGKDFPDEINKLNVDLTLLNLWNDTMIAERRTLKESGAEVKKGGALKNIPLTVISAGNNGFKEWELYQKELGSYSDKSSSLFIKDSDHFIHHDYADKVIEEINKIIEK